MNNNAYTKVKLSVFERTLIDFTNALYDTRVLDSVSKEEIRDVLSSGQVMSKKWLLEELHRQFIFDSATNIVVCGGWVGFLTQLLNNSSPFIFADTLDISKDAITAADVVTGSTGKSTSICADMYAFDYNKYDIVINTSSEHIPDLKEWTSKIKKGTTVVLQSNNARHIKEHISCVDSAEELAEKAGLEECFYLGELIFPMYTRYMVIGKL